MDKGYYVGLRDNNIQNDVEIRVLQMMAYLWLAEKEGLEVNIETTRMPELVGVAAQVIHHPNEVLNGRPPF